MYPVYCQAIIKMDRAFDEYHLCIDQDGKHDINDTMLFAYISLKHNSNIIYGQLSVSEGVQKALFFMLNSCMLF